MSLLNKIKLIEKAKKNRHIPLEPIKPEQHLFLLGLAGFFSVAFSLMNLTLLGEVSLTTIVIGLFFLAVLIVNEKAKVSSLVQYRKKNLTKHLLTSITCILISLTSLYGIYINVNNMDTIINQKEKIESSKTLHITKSIDSLSYLSTRGLDSLTKIIHPNLYTQYDLYSKRIENTSTPYRNDLRELDKISKEISKEKELIQTELESKKQKLEKTKATVSSTIKSSTKNTESRLIILTIIACGLSLIVEAVIVLLALARGANEITYVKELQEYNQALKKYKEDKEKDFLNSVEVQTLTKYVEIIRNVYLTNSKGSKITKSYLGSFINLTKKEVEEFYKVLKSLGIIAGSNQARKLNVTKDEAITLLDDYFTKLINED